MAAPTQELPPWLTLSTGVFTDASGSPVTSTTLLYLPLTYYGPSIPLDSDWTYGGLTSPAPTTSATLSTPFVTTITTVVTSLPTPSPSSAIPSATPTPTPVPSTSSISTSLPPTSTPTSLTPFVHSGLSKNALIGVILGAILGTVVVIFIFLLILRWRVRRRNPEGEPPTMFSFETPVWAEWHMVDGEPEQRRPDQGSPRHSEEANPFLTRRAEAATSTPEASGSGTQPMRQRNERGGKTKLVTVPSSAGTPARAQQDQTANIHAGTRAADHSDAESSTSAASGYGTLLEPSPTAHSFPDPYPKRGHIIPPSDLLRMHEEEEESIETGQEHHSPLLPPPRIVDPGQSGRPSYASHKNSVSSSSDVEDAPALFTARRVRVQELGPRTSPVTEEAETSTSSAGTTRPSGWAGSLAAGLGRLSWFKNIDPSPSRNSRSYSRPGSWLRGSLNDKELEAGRSLLGSDYKRPSPLGFGFNVLGDRPGSSVSASARSGNTVYYDARSSVSGTPTRLSPLPRALTPSGQTPAHSHDLLFNTPNRTRPNSAPLVIEEPPAYDDTHILDTQSPTQSNLNMTLPPGVDILDLPAPPPLSPFTSTASTSSIRMISPPGLATLLPNTKPLMETDGTPSIGSFITRTEFSNDGPVAITVDLLEQEPPTAGDGWRSLAGGMANVAVGHGRRTTFGTPHFIHQIPLTASTQASLHSMPSGLSPGHSSAGSAPTSARHASPSRTNSSGPSGFSARLTGSSGSGLSRTGSITSDGRRRRRGVGSGFGAISPTLSAFGPHDREHLAALYPGRPRSPLGHIHTDTIASVTGRTTRSAETTETVDGDPLLSPVSPLMHFPDMPWASGL